MERRDPRGRGFFLIGLDSWAGITVSMSLWRRSSDLMMPGFLLIHNGEPRNRNEGYQKIFSIPIHEVQVMTESSEAIGLAISLMAVAARTAPKGKGKDSIVTHAVHGSELPLLADEMTRFGQEHNQPFFVRDAKNVAASEACLLLGVRGQEILGLNCGGCGYQSCADMEAACRNPVSEGSPFRGPNCVIKMADLGIAIGSAVKTASILNLDNRVMYTAGVAARSLGWMEGCSVAYGIPVSITGKNIYFDRHG